MRSCLLRRHRFGITSPAEPPKLLWTLSVAAFLSVSLAAGPATATSPDDFPAEIFAPVLVPEGTPRELTIVAMYVESSEQGPTVHVRFTKGWAPPEGKKLDVGVFVGAPEGRTLRAGVTVRDGKPAGSVARGVDGRFAEGEATTARVEDEEISVVLPGRLLAGLDLDRASIWATVAADGRKVTSPLFPTAALMGEATSLRPAEVAWLRPGSPELVAVPPGPALKVSQGRLQLSFDRPPPDALDGRLAVAQVVEVVRLVPDFGRGGRASHILAVNHRRREVSLLDARSTMPALVPGSRTAVPDYPEVGRSGRFTLEVDTAALARAMGLDPGSTFGVGVARSIDLEDGRVVRVDGPVASPSWFADRQPDGATEAPSRDADGGGTEVESPSDDREGIGRVVLVLVVLAVVGLVAVVVRRLVLGRKQPPEEPSTYHSVQSDLELTRAVVGASEREEVPRGSPPRSP
ncbi:MAG: hypothetical protein KatS3mg008_1793 [Acidimicrobiales bacterium]|nr:MAG: hypothetical protein KatS3mg008_1793 [Acidimicrobiales bacterium]